ncbi:MAG: hypothetical protein DWQ31_02845 [Planctomycetota bacterium]|nr:MAG: hypothetical protein DWQ31_02845 [Planctomycetota bacterium]
MPVRSTRRCSSRSRCRSWKKSPSFSSLVLRKSISWRSKGAVGWAATPSSQGPPSTRTRGGWNERVGKRSFRVRWPKVWNSSRPSPPMMRFARPCRDRSPTEQAKERLVNEPHVLSLNPLIVTIDDFLDTPTIDHIRSEAQGRFERARMGASGDIVSQGRSNSHCNLDQRSDPILGELCARIGLLVRFPPEFAEPLAILRYEPEQEYGAHFDAWNFDETEIPERLRTFGQRYYTSIMYLNDDFEGGATVFPKIGLTVAPRRGQLVLWSNTILGGNRPHALSLHAGEPVTAGEKWVASFWWMRKIMPEPAILPPGE